MSTYEKTVAVISKPPDLRQDFEVQSLLPWFRKKSKLFSKLKTDICKDIVRNCQFITRNRDEIIIKQGDRGDCFYIIIGGKISIYILNVDKEDEQEKKALEEIGIPDKKLDRNKLGNFAVSLGEGVPFGEVALISDDCIRTATVVADEKTDLVVVDRQLYNRSVRDVLAQEFEEKETFIKTNRLFSTWAPKYRKQLAMALYKDVFQFESFLTKQGEPLTNCYFLLSGHVEVQVDPTTHPNQFPKIFQTANQNEEDKLTKKTDKPVPPTDTQAAGSKKSKNFKVCYLGVNEAVGDVELLLDLDTYVQSTVCMEKTDVLVLEKKHYERLFLKRHPRTIDQMRLKLEFKLHTRFTLLNSTEDMPLFAHLLKRVSAMVRPPPPREKEKKQTKTTRGAEREFLNHKGPLIDMYGPGSVFYLIRLREKFRSRRNAHLLSMKTQPVQPSQHTHAIHVPNSLAVAAKTSGAVVVPTEDTKAYEPKPLKLKPRPHSARVREKSSPRSFRRINSASNKLSSSDEATREAIMGANNDFIAGDLEPNRHVTVTFNDDEDDDAALSMLEEKMRQWLTYDNYSRRAVKVAQLRRFSAQESQDRPKPGNKVVIRKRKKVIHDRDSPDEMNAHLSEGESIRLKLLLGKN